MCGICGKFIFDREGRVPASLMKAMADTIHHRGPDDDGYYTSGQIGFGFRRLSIIDLNSGHQPISNESDTIRIIFNGEIYNYQALREELLRKGHVFKTKTDTEVILHLYEDYGAECVKKLRGMFVEVKAARGLYAVDVVSPLHLIKVNFEYPALGEELLGLPRKEIFPYLARNGLFPWTKARS